MKINWEAIADFCDISYERGLDDAKGVAKITINRPKVRNAFRPKTVFELKKAFSLAREDQECGVIIFTGKGEKAFCSGGDQTIRGDAGYVCEDGVPRLNILDV